MADVFISYAREDRPVADQMARGLQGLGLECFWDTEIPPGQTWADYIEGKLAACKVVIVVWSAHSVGSQWVREEARMGRDKGKLIPVVLDNSPPPFGFGEVQAANLSTWRGEGDHPEWRRFASAVQAAVRGGASAPPPKPQPAFAAPPQSMSTAASDTSPIAYVQKCLRMYFDGKGRARRAEYWWWTLFATVAAVIAYVVDGVLFGYNGFTGALNAQVVSTVASLGLAAPAISVMSRRLHDVGLSGWLAAAFLGAYAVGSALALEIPVLGAVLALAGIGAALVVALLPSAPGANQYGPNPKTG